GRIKQCALIDAGQVVAGIVDTIDLPANVQLAVEKLPTIVYDEAQLTQVFQNLIVNAIAHAEVEHISIRVSCRETEDGWEFAVRDNGVGIAPEHHERVFQMFQTLDPAKRSTGLGLTIFRKIVESNDGRVRLESTPGGGTSIL